MRSIIDCIKFEKYNDIWFISPSIVMNMEVVKNYKFKSISLCFLKWSMMFIYYKKKLIT